MIMIKQQYANEVGYTDVKPYEIVKVISKKTIEVRRMDHKLLNAEDLKFHVGGFSAHCSNQRDQKYEYSSNTENEVIRVRLHKDGYYHCRDGAKFRLADKPYKFYDYNF